MKNSNDKEKVTDAKAKKTLQYQQKEETIKNVLQSVKQNPKFLRMLNYSLNSLENFVSPPNIDIKANAKILLTLDAVGILKGISTIHLTNEEVVNQTGSILWKVISFKDTVDQELAKQFVDNQGHETVIEILLSKNKGSGTKPFVKILNGLTQMSQLVQKLIDSGIIETVKLVNDIYQDDLEVITLNLEIMKKISNCKIGREMILKKNLVPNLVRNIQISSSHNDSKAVTAGLGILDNISRTEEGKEAITKANAFKHISNVLDNFGTNDQILKMGAKIYSKISKEDDMRGEIENLQNFKIKEDYKDLKELEKPLVLISNFILVDDNCAMLSQSENVQLLHSLFEGINTVDITDKPLEYIKKSVLMNKFFVIVFNRICLNYPELIEKNPLLLDSITDSILKCWDWTENIMNNCKESVEIINSFSSVFKEYFCAFVDLFDKSIQLKGISSANINVIKYILKKLVNSKKYFELDERANFAASRILVIANKIDDDEIKLLFSNLFEYIKNLMNTSSEQITLFNVLQVMLTIIKKSGSITLHDLNLNNSNLSQKGILIPVLINFMNTKPHYRQSNFVNLQIIEEIISSPIFLDYHFKNQNKRINFIPPIISVMAKHLYQTSNVLKVFATTDNSADTSKPKQSETIDNESLELSINNRGAYLLEKLVDMTDLKRSLKSFKEIASGFNPTNSNGESITNLEQLLLFFYAVLRINSYFLHSLYEIHDGVKNLIKKEINYAENLKKEKSSDIDKKTEELLNSSSKRLNLMIAIVRLLHDLCNSNLLEKENEGMIKPIYDIFSTLIDILDKSSDSTNLTVLVTHIKKNVDFLNEKEETIEYITQKTQSNNTQDIRFDSPILERVTNSLINVLRKKVDEEDLASNIVNTCIAIANKQPESCNNLVQAGCTRTLLELVDKTSNASLVKDVIELTKVISFSSEENLIVLGNQNIIEKFHSIQKKFPNEPELNEACNLIANELVKLPGLENVLKEIIQTNVQELHEIIEERAMDDLPGKVTVLNNLEKFNAYATNKKQKEILADIVFLNDLDAVIKNTINDKEVSDINEKLLQNELALLKKVNEEILLDTNIADKENKLEPIIDNVINIMVEKNHYRDVYLNAASILTTYITNEKVFKRHLSAKLDKKFLDSLFDTADNYLDDSEVSREVNNIMCNLCLQSEEKSNYIVEKGGLYSVIDELKSLVSLNDDSSKKMKLNGLKLLHSLVKDYKNMQSFVNSKGVELIINLIKNESNLYYTAAVNPDGSKSNQKNFYLTNDLIALNPIDTSIKSKENNKNEHIVYCLRIIKENNKKKFNSFTDPRLFKYILQLIDESYPNKHLFKKGMKVINKCLQNDVVVEKNEKRYLVQVILSYVANNITDRQIFNLSKIILDNVHMDYEDNEFELLLQQKNKILETNNFSHFGRFLTFVSLLVELKGERLIQTLEDIISLSDFFEYALDLYNSALFANNKNIPCSEGISLALTKLANNLSKLNVISKEKVSDVEIDIKLQSIGLHYFQPSSPVFVSEYLKEFKEIFTTLETTNEEGEAKESYVNYLQNIYLRSFDFFDYYNNIQCNVDIVNKELVNKSEKNMTEIMKEMVEYYKIDQDQDIKVSTTRNLVSQCLVVLSSSNNNSAASNKENKHVKNSTDNEMKNASTCSSINKSVWDLLYNVTNKDMNNVVCGNQDVIETIVEKLNETIEQSPKDNLYRDYYELITSKVENNVDLFEKMIEFVQKDFEQTMSHIEISKSGELNPEISIDKSNPLNDNAIASPCKDSIISNLEIVSNISKFPITSKILLKNENLFNHIKDLYTSPNLQIESRVLLSNIMKNLLVNNLNSETLITKHSDLIKGFFNNLVNNKPDLETDQGKEVARNEIESFVTLVNDNYQLLSEVTSIVTNEDILKAVEIYKDDPILSEKLQNLHEQVDEISKISQREKHLAKDRELTQNLTGMIKELFEQHLKELNSLDSESNSEAENNKRLSCKLVTSSNNVIGRITNDSKSRMSLIYRTLFFNTDNTKIKSPLSSKDNCDIPQAIDQMLNLSRKLYNDCKSEADENLKVEKNNMIFSLLNALKQLSISQDNHIIILEGGLINFLEKIKQDSDNPIYLYIETIDVIKNCTLSENTMQAFLSSAVADSIVDEVIKLYEQPDLLAINLELKQLFYILNIILSGICKYKKGFSYLLKKIGFEKLLLIGNQTHNIDILTAILEMLINYIENHEKEEIQMSLIKDIIEIVIKTLDSKNKTSKVVSFAFRLAGMVYSKEVIDRMNKLDLVKKINNDFDTYAADPEFINSILIFLNNVTRNNVHNARDTVDSGLLDKIKEITKVHINNEKIIEKISLLYRNLLINNLENIEKFCKNGIVLNIFYIIENYWNGELSIAPTSNLILSSANNINSIKPHSTSETSSSMTSSSRIVLNCVASLDSMTVSEKAIAYFSDTKFPVLIFDLFERRRDEADTIKSALHCLGNYLYKEIGGNMKTVSFEKVLQLLQSLQKKYYSNSEILININYIAGYLIKIMKEKQLKKKLFLIITNSIKMQDWNVALISMTLKMMYDVLILNIELIDDIFEENMQSLFTLLKVYKDKVEIQCQCYKLLTMYGRNHQYSHTMVNAGLIELIKATFDSDIYQEKKSGRQLHHSMFSLISLLSFDANNVKKISDVLMSTFINLLNNEAFVEGQSEIIKLLYTLTRQKITIEALVQYKGAEAIKNVLKEDIASVQLISDCFSILTAIADQGEEYKKMLNDEKVPEIINEVIRNSGHLDRNIEFDGRSLIFAINSGLMKIEEVKEVSFFSRIKVENPIKPDIKNFLTDGKIVKIITMRGDVKSMLVSMTQDFNKIIAKKPNSNAPPKPKYVFETLQIKQIIKGHGTEAFKKSKGFFRKIPSAEKCFSVFGPTTAEGVKCLNVECETEQDVNKWIDNIEIVIKYFKKTNAYKSNILIKK